MGEHDYSEKRECGCQITLVEDCGELEEIILKYCFKHEAAEPLYVAAVWALAELQQGADFKGSDHYTVVRMVQAAIALAEREVNDET